MTFRCGPKRIEKTCIGRLNTILLVLTSPQEKYLEFLEIEYSFWTQKAPNIGGLNYEEAQWYVSYSRWLCRILSENNHDLTILQRHVCLCMQANKDKHVFVKWQLMIHQETAWKSSSINVISYRVSSESRLPFFGALCVQQFWFIF